MKNLLITLPMFLALTACDKAEEDTAADDDFAVDEGASDDDAGDDDGGGDDGGGGGGGGLSAAPGCDYSGALCMAYDGGAWAGQEEAQCDAYSQQSEAAGGPAFTYAAGGCPTGAIALCDGFLAGQDQDGNLVPGSEMILYFYSGLPEANAQDLCGQYGGTFSTL